MTEVLGFGLSCFTLGVVICNLMWTIMYHKWMLNINDIINIHND